MLNSQRDIVRYIQSGEHYHPDGQAAMTRLELVESMRELREWLAVQEEYILEENFGLPSAFHSLAQKVSDASANLKLALKMAEYRSLGRDSNEAYKEALERRAAWDKNRG